jgi:DNA-binding response OmpR family regulator
MARILIVDDHPGCRLALAASLKSKNHEIFEFERGQDAVETYPVLLPDLVLLDVLMPEQDGIETLIALKKLVHQAPIILMSDGGVIGIDQHFGALRMMGAASTLKKPFSMDELNIAINAALS